MLPFRIGATPILDAVCCSFSTFWYFLPICLCMIEAHRLWLLVDNVPLAEWLTTHYYLIVCVCVDINLKTRNRRREETRQRRKKVVSNRRICDDHNNRHQQTKHTYYTSTSRPLTKRRKKVFIVGIERKNLLTVHASWATAHQLITIHFFSCFCIKKKYYKYWVCFFFFCCLYHFPWETFFINFPRASVFLCCCWMFFFPFIFSCLNGVIFRVVICVKWFNNNLLMRKCNLE